MWAFLSDAVTARPDLPFEELARRHLDWVPTFRPG